MGVKTNTALVKEFLGMWGELSDCLKELEQFHVDHARIQMELHNKKAMSLRGQRLVLEQQIARLAPDEQE